ncbi:type VII secretion integral membrane protein EccD [Mycobacterium sp. UM_Kg1]|uniref:type VII secretion integral membrane protein EccD n=1 Tax=Mycobacterium sp. UM_Kg1 TaxID=1545691 RepID=UPI000AC94A2D|nr:type VII secretion integral membrane protein EccD [Mycobacterium sp. UM_Kg1]
MANAVIPIVRIAVLAESRLTEIAVPADLPLREILPTVQRLVVPSASDEGDGSGDDTALDRLTLAPIGGAPFSLDASLDTVGVVDGDLLALQPVPAGPSAPGIVEDIADAAVIFSASRRKPWGQGHVRAGSLAAVVGLIVLATGLAVTHRLATGAPTGLIAVGAVAVLTAIAALVVRPPHNSVLSIAALVPIAAALTLAVPGPFGPAQVTLGAAGVAAWSLIVVVGLRRDLGFFTATSVVGAGVALAAAVETSWELPLSSIGGGLVVLALLLTVSAPHLSALWARFPLPAIPAPGDPTPSAPSLRVLEDLPRRVEAGERYQTGFIAGGVLLGALGAFAIAARPEAAPSWGWYVVIASVAAAALRARVWDSVAGKSWLLAQPFLVATALAVLYGATGRYLAALIAVAAFAGLAAVWALAAAVPAIADPHSYSLPVRRLVGFLASGLDASLIPAVAYFVGIFSWVLNR